MKSATADVKNMREAPADFFFVFFLKRISIFVLRNLHSSSQRSAVSAIRDFRQISVSTPRSGRNGLGGRWWKEGVLTE